MIDGHDAGVVWYSVDGVTPAREELTAADDHVDLVRAVLDAPRRLGNADVQRGHAVWECAGDGSEAHARAFQSLCGGWHHGRVDADGPHRCCFVAEGGTSAHAKVSHTLGGVGRLERGQVEHAHELSQELRRRGGR